MLSDNEKQLVKHLTFYGLNVPETLQNANHMWGLNFIKSDTAFCHVSGTFRP